MCVNVSEWSRELEREIVYVEKEIMRRGTCLADFQVQTRFLYFHIACTKICIENDE